MNPKGEEQKKCEGDAAQQVTSLPDLSLEAGSELLAEQPNPTAASALGTETSEGKKHSEVKESAEAKAEFKTPGEKQKADSSKKTEESAKAEKPEAETEKKKIDAGGDGEKIEKGGNAAGITDDEKIEALKESPPSGKKATGEAKADSPSKGSKSKTPEEQRSPNPVPDLLTNFRPKAKIASQFADRFGEDSRRPSVTEDEYLEKTRLKEDAKSPGGASPVKNSASKRAATESMDSLLEHLELKKKKRKRSASGSEGHDHDQDTN
ncbi:uncharacterized protein Dana_GF20404 [Drosophila ananassae]|uniref:Uncharacterized protein n=1 Tax=Drosophila ananassae TaxID=7217 RepID=B3MQ94_DROAN|nr:neurofilament medium polypeptide [Drosophila ananassae]EDV44520.2 uncharacterized protein Dana_GF20404 [Drosophila ananassae]